MIGQRIISSRSFVAWVPEGSIQNQPDWSSERLKIVVIKVGIAQLQVVKQSRGRGKKGTSMPSALMELHSFAGVDLDQLHGCCTEILG